MGLLSRLSTLKQQSGAVVYDSLLEEKTAPSVAERLGRYQVSQTNKSVTKQPKDDSQLAQLMGGELIHPGVIKIEQRIPLDSHHGSIALNRLAEKSLDFPEYKNLKLKECLFFDTETTGLSGGSGTLVFMLGMGRIEGDTFLVCQLMLTSFKGETQFLKEAATWAKDAKTLVSFNGKSFDSPLLNSRYRMKASSDPFQGKEHIDLLYSVRRAFANVWPDCRLGTTERRLLKFKRTNDLPGAQAPEAWLSYVKYGDMQLLPRVAEHNYWDIVSLAALIPALGDVFNAPQQFKADVLGVARFYWKQNQVKQAKTILESNLKTLDDQALLELSNIYRKLKNWEPACNIWKQLSQRGCQESSERLAKYYEHVRKDYQQALHYADQLPASLGKQRVGRLNNRMSGQQCLFS